MLSFLFPPICPLCAKELLDKGERICKICSKKQIFIKRTHMLFLWKINEESGKRIL